MLKTKKYNYLNSQDKLNIKKLFSILEKLSTKHPYLVILILHEYYRSLYSFDPYIKFKIQDPSKRIKKLIKELINFATLSFKIGSYNIKLERKFFFRDHKNEFEEIKKKNRKCLWAFVETF